MGLKDVFNLFKNVAEGPNSTVAGLVLGAMGGYMIYHTEGDLSYLSIEIGILLLGLFLFLSGDSIFGIHKKKDKKEDGEQDVE